MNKTCPISAQTPPQMQIGRKGARQNGASAQPWNRECSFVAQTIMMRDILTSGSNTRNLPDVRCDSVELANVKRHDQGCICDGLFSDKTLSEQLIASVHALGSGGRCIVNVECILFIRESMNSEACIFVEVGRRTLDRIVSYVGRALPQWSMTCDFNCPFFFRLV
jgi:hypothetical protein